MTVQLQICIKQLIMGPHYIFNQKAHSERSPVLNGYFDLRINGSLRAKGSPLWRERSFPRSLWKKQFPKWCPVQNKCAFICLPQWLVDSPPLRATAEPGPSWVLLEYFIFTKCFIKVLEPLWQGSPMWEKGQPHVDKWQPVAAETQDLGYHPVWALAGWPWAPLFHWGSSFSS